MNEILLISIITGLVTAVVYAVQGITEGLSAKHTRYYELAFSTQMSALLCMIVIAIIFQQSVAIDVQAVFIAAILGAIYALSLHFYFRALRTGPMNIVSPISGSYSIVAIPIAVLFLGEILTLTQYIGVAFIIMGVFLVDFKVHKRTVTLVKRKYLLYAFITLVLWGIYMPVDSILIEQSSWFTALFWELIFVNIFLGAALFKRESLKAFKKSMPRLLKVSIVIGLCEAIGGLVMNYGLDKGNVSIVTPLITFSTVITVLFATFFLKQKLSRQQAAGVFCAVAGIVILGA